MKTCAYDRLRLALHGCGGARSSWISCCGGKRAGRMRRAPAPARLSTRASVAFLYRRDALPHRQHRCVRTPTLKRDGGTTAVRCAIASLRMGCAPVRASPFRSRRLVSGRCGLVPPHAASVFRAWARTFAAGWRFPRLRSLPGAFVPLAFSASIWAAGALPGGYGTVLAATTYSHGTPAGSHGAPFCGRGFAGIPAPGGTAQVRHHTFLCRFFGRGCGRGPFRAGVHCARGAFCVAATVTTLPCLLRLLRPHAAFTAAPPLHASFAAVTVNLLLPTIILPLPSAYACLLHWRGAFRAVLRSRAALLRPSRAADVVPFGSSLTTFWVDGACLPLGYIVWVGCV